MESTASAEPIEWPAGRPALKLALTATPDPMGGFNLRVKMAINHAPYQRDGNPIFATTAVQVG
jgi:hypothetical protein